MHTGSRGLDECPHLFESLDTQTCGWRHAQALVSLDTAVRTCFLNWSCVLTEQPVSSSPCISVVIPVPRACHHSVESTRPSDTSSAKVFQSKMGTLLLCPPNFARDLAGCVCSFTGFVCISTHERHHTNSIASI